MKNAMRKKDRELARRLAPEAVEPPEGLLERLKADIPEELPTIHRGGHRRDDGDGGGRDRVLRFPGTLAGLSTGAVVKAAAAVVLAVGAGFLALQVHRQTPDLQVQEAGESLVVSSPEAGRSEAQRGAGEGIPDFDDELEQRKREIFDRRESLKRKRTEGEVAPPPPERPPVTEKSPSPAEPAPPPPAAQVAPAAPPRPTARPEPKSAQKPAPVWVGTDAPLTFRGGSPRREAAEESPDTVESDALQPAPESNRATEQLDRLGYLSSIEQREAATEELPEAETIEPPRDLAHPVRDLEIEVRHEEGQILPGAVLHLRDAAGNDLTAVAGEKGRAYFYDIPAGEYQVRAELEGFQTVTRRVTPPETEERELAMNLPLASVQEEIVVVGEKLEVSPTMTFSAATVASASVTVAPGAEVPDAFGKRFDRPPVPENPLVDTAYDALSTFGLDVDTGSYGLVRRHLMEGSLPSPQTVRIEELLNAFDYGDPAPARGDFAVTAQGAVSPFRPGLHLLRLGIQAREVSAEERKPAALTFVVDISGSMQQADKLDLAKQALGLLLDQLEPEDTVALVTYGSDAQVVLGHTADKEAIRSALDELGDGGSTNAEAGLLLGYEEARRAFRPGAVNRVVLCSDGVANVGATDPEALLERVGREARGGVELTTLGFGMGTYNDHLMEQLADKGDGRYAYLDDLIEAHRVLVEELTGTVQTVARDARVQLELNPDTVKRYRLLGYENRDIADHRFRYDDQDAGEIGSGHAVTVLYELELKPSTPDTAPLAVLRLRWWSVAEDRFVEMEEPVYRRDLVADWDRAAPALRWAALTARFAQALRGQAPMAELPDLADQMHRLTVRAWPADDRRAELGDLARRAAEVHRDLLQRSGGIRPAEGPQEP